MLCALREFSRKTRENCRRCESGTKCSRGVTSSFWTSPLSPSSYFPRRSALCVPHCIVVKTYSSSPSTMRTVLQFCSVEEEYNSTFLQVILHPTPNLRSYLQIDQMTSKVENIKDEFYDDESFSFGRKEQFIRHRLISINIIDCYASTSEISFS